MAAKKKSASAKQQSKAKSVPKKAAKAAKKAPTKAADKPAKASVKKAVPKAGTPKRATPKAGTSKQGTPKQGTSKQGTPKQGTPKQVEKPTLLKTLKRAATKVAQVAATAAIKVLDSDAGRAAPVFDLTDEKGERVSSSSLAGKPYLLYFYPKDDTPGCTKEACDIRDNFARFGQQGLRVLGVSPDSEQSHAKFGRKYGLPFTLLSDPDKTLAKAYGVWGEKDNYGKKYMGIIRSSFLVGPDGVIKKAYRKVRVDGHVAAILEDAKTHL